MNTRRVLAALCGLALSVPLGVNIAVPAASATGDACADDATTKVTVSGVQNAPYRGPAFSSRTRVDARTASWTREAAGDYPVVFKDKSNTTGSSMCLLGGRITSSTSESASWAQVWHRTYGLFLGEPRAEIRGLWLENQGGGIGLHQGASGAVIRGVYADKIHDDVIENNWQGDVTVEDSRLAGYVLFAGRGYSGMAGGTPDGRDNTYSITRTLAWLQPQRSVFTGPVPGNGPLFKRANGSAAHGFETRFVIKDSIFRIDRVPNDGDLSIPPGPHSGNTIVWTGGGAYPGPVPAGFTLSTDKGVWDRADAAWRAVPRSDRTSPIAPKPTPTPTPTPTPRPPAAGTPAGNIYTAAFPGTICKIGVVADIASTPADVVRAKAVKAVMDAAKVQQYVLPGDLAYPHGSRADFDDNFKPVYGYANAKMRPSPGNHEWDEDNASAYYSHAFPGIPARYAYDACGWRLISVDTESSKDADAAAEFIRAENAKAPDQPTAIQWHKPRWSSNDNHGSNSNQDAVWKAAVDTKAALVWNGHDHCYERFDALGATGKPTPGGVTEFVIGTGGREQYKGFTALPGSAKRLDTYNGAGIFTLTFDGRWSMEYVDTSGTVRDAASGVSPTRPNVGPAPSPGPFPGPTPTPGPTPGPTPPSASGVLDLRVSASSDDAEEEISTGVTALDSSDLEATYDKDRRQLIGVRFTDLNIPRGATHHPCLARVHLEGAALRHGDPVRGSPRHRQRGHVHNLERRHHGPSVDHRPHPRRAVESARVERGWEIHLTGCVEPRAGGRRPRRVVGGQRPRVVRLRPRNERHPQCRHLRRKPGSGADPAHRVHRLVAAAERPQPGDQRWQIPVAPATANPPDRFGAGPATHHAGAIFPCRGGTCLPTRGCVTISGDGEEMVLGWPAMRLTRPRRSPINLGLVDLGQIDLLVQEGFYANRTDFIRSAIRTQLATRASAVDQSVKRNALVLGTQNYSRADLERLGSEGNGCRSASWALPPSPGTSRWTSRWPRSTRSRCSGPSAPAPP